MTQEGGGEKREHAGGVLGVAFGLALLLLLSGATVYQLFNRPVDGAARVSELFGGKPPPFGLALERAVRLSTGEVVVRLARSSESGADAALPEEVLFIEYRSPAAVPPLFRSGPEPEGGASRRKLEWEKKKDFAWHTTLKKGEIAWGAWRSTLLVERSFRKGGGWQDEARVDLSRKGRALVLFAHWPLDAPADEKKLEELLAAITVESGAAADGPGE